MMKKIDGSFYEQELQTPTQEMSRTEKVIRRDYKNKLAFISEMERLSCHFQQLGSNYRCQINQVIV